MNGTRWSAYATLALLLVPRFLGAQARPDLPPTGWYVTDTGRRMLVSPAPDSGYRTLDFANAEFGPFVVASEDPLEAGQFRVVQGDDGEIRALETADGLRWRRMPDAPYTLREVGFESGDGVRLAGLVLQPERSETGVVLIHGSGSSDRDNVWAFTFAHALADAGICVLFPDKRGSGASEGNWRKVGLDALARDAIAGAHFLSETCDLSSDRVGWLGLSQGGWVAPLAHRFSAAGAFQIGVSAAAVPIFDQMEHEAINTLRASGMTEFEVNSARRLLKTTGAFATGSTPWSSYSALRDSLSDGPLRAFVAAMPADSADWRWSWWNRVGRIDPVDSWAQSRIPVLLVYGEEDQEDNVPVERSVRRLDELRRSPGRPPVNVLVFEGRGHTLVEPDSGWIDKVVLEQIARWVLARGEAASTGGGNGSPRE